METCLIGLDVGTTSTKAVIFNQMGEELAHATSPPYRIHTPHPSWVEQDPEDLWQATLLVIKELMSQVGSDIHVRALSIAAQSGSLLPADKAGNPVYNLITWMDGRTHDLVLQWRESEIRSQVRSLSGWSLYPGLCLPTIAWLRLNDERTFSATRRYFSVNDFIAHRLTGEFITNPSNAGGMQLVNIHTGQWSETLCNLAGIRTDQLSQIQPSGSMSGVILPEVCKITGLTPGTVLINGGHDQACTALGLGIIDPGKLLLACGTAWVFTGVQTAAEIVRIPPSLDMNFHAFPGRWVVSQSLGGLGASLEWWLNQAWNNLRVPSSRQEVFSALNTEMAGTDPADDLFFIPLTGGHEDPATTRSGAFIGLQIAHNRAQMARSIMESAGFELRWALEALKSVGMPVNIVSMVGGAASSPYWPQILTDINNLPIQIPEYENWPSLGAGILAGLGSDLFSSVDQALSFFQKPLAKTTPDPLRVELYNQRYSKYKQISSIIQKINRPETGEKRNKNKL